MSLATCPSRLTRSDLPLVADPGSRPRRSVVALVLVLGYGLFMAMYGLNSTDLYRNEGLRALVAAETLRTGHWLAPTLHGEPFLTKPPGMTAAIGLCSWPLGEVRAWTARLPSVLAAAISIGLVLFYFSRHWGPGAGLVAAALLPASLFWLDRSPSAEIDMLQLAWVLAALVCFLLALEAAETVAGNRTAWWLGALLCVAGGFLTKWTAPAFFYLTVVPLLWRRGRLRLLLGRGHLVALAVAGSLCLAWIASAAGQVSWRVLTDTVLREALPRLSPQQHPRPYPWGEIFSFPLLFLAGTLPWSAFALVTLHPRFVRLWDARGQRLVQTLHCWLWANLLFWALVPGHRPRHCLPLQPPVAALAAMVWIAWLDGRLRWPLAWCRPLHALGGVLLLFVVAKVAFVHVYRPARDAESQWRAKGTLLASLVPPGETLYLEQLKDEGLLFYCHRPTRRIAWRDLEQIDASIHLILTAREWLHWPGTRDAEVLARLSDGQGAPLVLVKVKARL